VIFWLAFFIIITGLFLVKRDQIRETLNATQFISRLKNPGAARSPAQPSADTETPAAPAVTPEKSAPLPAKPVQNKPEKTAPAKTVTKTEPVKTAAPKAETQSPAQNTTQGTPPAATVPAKTPAAQQPAVQQARERTIYFTQVDKDGAILRSKVTRQIPASDSPMLDSLNALLQGPNTDERRRNFVSLIPAGSRILSATVRGSTAYISFSEEFQYNTYGVEGYAAQLKQIVWTVTEFSNVKDVQILIEGRRIDYLGEGIWIGSPIGRDTL
jgi:spore germination protein GerM